MDGRDLDCWVVRLANECRFAWLAGGSGFAKVENEGGKWRGEVAESRVGDEHGLEEDGEGVALRCED